MTTFEVMEMGGGVKITSVRFINSSVRQSIHGVSVNGKRVDSFLKLANAKRKAKLLVEFIK